MGNILQEEPIRLQLIVEPHEYFERIEGKELENNPHRSIVAIKGKTDSGMPFFGSGVLLSKDTVLTAAHNIFYHPQKKLNNKFKVYHKPQGITTKYHEVQSWKYLSLFEGPKLQIKFDYALIKLKPDQKLSIDYNDFPKLLVTCSKCFQKTQQLKIGIFGYPKELSEDPYNTQNFKPQTEGGISIFQYGFQLKNRVQLIDHKNFVIKYKINTKGGQSGW